METQEVRGLRIGNWVSNGLNYIEFDVDCFLNINTLSFITLTEEWLLKFGFYKSKLEGYDTHFVYTKGNMRVSAIYNAEFSCVIFGVAKAINYVHQLQNLYFALTEQEL